MDGPPVTPTTHRYSVRGLDLAYHAWGPEDGTPLLCLHGFMDHGQSYRFMVEHLPEGYRVVAPDMRGHGESGWVGAGGYYHFYDYFDDMRRLVDRLGWERFTLVAHSMGGSVASGVTAMRPERVERLIMLEGMGPPFAQMSELPNKLVKWSDALGKRSCELDVDGRRASRRPLASVAAAAERLRLTNPRLPEDRALALATTFTEPVEGGVVWRQDPLHRTPGAKPYTFEEAQALWQRITCPVLSLMGQQSPWAQMAEADRATRLGQLAEATELWVPEAGHNLHHDRPELIAAAVHAWRTDAALPAELAAAPS